MHRVAATGDPLSPVPGAMTTPLTTSTQIYPVRDGSPLTLEIVIGELQAGGTSIIWQGAITDLPGNVGPTTLTADGGTVRMSALHCATRVRDVNPNTNRTTVTYILRGGRQDQEFTYSLTVPEENGFADYVIDFVFI